MGNRALIQVEDNTGELSPVLYLHWANDVKAVIEATKTQMGSRTGDVQYTFARLVENACKTHSPGDSTGIGVWNRETRLNGEASHGDEGCFVYNCDSGDTEHME